MMKTWTGRNRRDVNAQRVLRHAQAVIAHDLTCNRSVGDIAEAIGVKRRTLQRAFHDVLGTGVASFVRKTKLTAVRAELIDSDPGITSVTDVATKYGFTELGRFSVQYRSRFAESPSETLRREPIG